MSEQTVMIILKSSDGNTEFMFESRLKPFQKLQRDIQQRWSVQNPVVADPQYQYLGRGEYSITLSVEV